MVPILSQMNPIHNCPADFPEIILILFLPLPLSLPSDLLLSDFPFKILYAFLISTMQAACPAHHGEHRIPRYSDELIKIVSIPWGQPVTVSRQSVSQSVSQPASQPASH